MGRALSEDLRVRAMARLDDGWSVRRIAQALSIAPSTVVKWAKRRRETGSLSPGRIGGHVPPKISGEHREWLLSRLDEKAFTLRGLVDELTDRGLKVDYKTMWTFVHATGRSFKKKRAAVGAGPADGRAQA